MKRVFILLLVLTFGSIFADDLSPVGRWKTIDDATGEEKSIVRIWIEDGVLFGKIDSLFIKEGEDPHPICDECKGENKDKPVLGITIVWNMEQGKEYWQGGKILDPEDGKVYGCKLKVIENGKKLEMRGFLGISLLGRTQYWIRVE
ncbi:MAG: DUF2147 domain-containing protein [Candidatus Cloacimonadales bacterium]|nr:DUF2147 domain-containing protein [Candidatus Cloacimonadales bacterium]